MAPPIKPANIRQRTNRKAGASTITEITALQDSPAPKIPNPDGRVWHPLTLVAWAHAWASPMASQWIETDTDALGRLAVLWDSFYTGAISVMSEIRLQEQRFGLSPLDRSRLQWEVAKGTEAEERQQRRQMSPRRTGTNDPRRGLMAVVK